VPQLTDGQLLVGLASVVAMLHDDETYLQCPAEPCCPLDAQGFGRDLYLLTVPSADRTLLGAQLLAVDGHPIAQVMERIRSVTEPYWIEVLAGQHSVYLKYNQCLGKTRSTNTATTRNFSCPIRTSPSCTPAVS
jgi:hypothetical protein